MSIRIIAVGKKHESWIKEGIERHEERLRKPFDVEWILLPHSSREGREARQEESERIRSKLMAEDFVILLDERGMQLDSPAFSRLLQDGLMEHARITVVVGGAYGVDEELRTRANAVLSLSKMVFPHQMVRLILVEQIYRAEQIVRGGAYHHE